ncbi:MAG: hypothetical protein RR523_12615 [Cetobacterium sp.]|uniref:ABC-three component system middle component 1 n=1 Tax=Cetobacterium sp. TaxID=2071632 RepID=UPI002FC68B1D
MLDLVKKLYIEKNYQTIVQNDNNIFFKYKENGIEDNYIVVFYNGEITEKSIEEYLISFFEEKIVEYSAKGLIGEAFEKNISLILFLDTSLEKDLEKIRKIIYSIEESRIYFKRYVIEYKEREKKEFLNKFQAENEIFRSFENEIKSSSNFNIYKRGGISFYDLLIKFYIKIPFLEYIFDKENVEEEFIKKLKEQLKDSQPLIKMLREKMLENEIDTTNLLEENITEIEIINKIKELEVEDDI